MPLTRLEPADERRARRHFHARELIVGRPVLEEARPLVRDRGFDRSGLGTVLDVDLELEHRREPERLHVDRNIVGQLVLVDEPLVETRGLAAAEHGRRELEQFFVRIAEPRHVPLAVDARLRDVVGHRVARRVGARGGPRLLARHWRPGRNVAEVFLHLRLGDVGRDVADERDRDVRRAVVRLEPLLDVAE